MLEKLSVAEAFNPGSNGSPVQKVLDYQLHYRFPLQFRNNLGTESKRESRDRV